MRNTKNNRPIGVFDSGVGGLSVLIELEKILPRENFVFLADQLHVPYGEKSKSELVGLAYRIVDFFINKHDAKMVVIACNTSTCYSIDALRRKYSLPIIGTVPAVKPASEKTKSRVLKKLIEDNCWGMEVFNVGCKNLENAVEKGNIDNPRVHILLKKYLKKIKNSKIDYLVLGCTHYPFLKKSIRKYVKPPVKLLDGGFSIAKRVGFLLKTNFLKTGKKTKGKTLYLTTGNSAKFSKVAGKLLNKTIKSKTVKI